MLAQHATDPSRSYADLDDDKANRQQQQQQNGADEDADEDGGEAAPPPDPVDWEAPLREPEPGSEQADAAAAAASWRAPWEAQVEEEEQEEEDAAARRRRGVAAGAALAGEVLDAAERRRIVEVTELGMRFADAASDAGQEGESARSVRARGGAGAPQSRGNLTRRPVPRPDPVIQTRLPPPRSPYPHPQTPLAPRWACWCGLLTSCPLPSPRSSCSVWGRRG